MPWWMAGVSAWMASFSAWTFTGAAGKILSQGFYVVLLYWASFVPYPLLFFSRLSFPPDARGDAVGSDTHPPRRGHATVCGMAAAAVPMIKKDAGRPGVQRRGTILLASLKNLGTGFAWRNDAQGATSTDLMMARIAALGGSGSFDHAVTTCASSGLAATMACA
jgi:hypothetical protein